MNAQTLTDFSDAALLLRDLRVAAHLPEADAPGSVLMLIPTDVFAGHLPSSPRGAPGNVIAGLYTAAGRVYAAQDGAAQQVTHDGRSYRLGPLNPHAEPAPVDGYLLGITPADLRRAVDAAEPSPAPAGTSRPVTAAALGAAVLGAAALGTAALGTASLTTLGGPDPLPLLGAAAVLATAAALSAAAWILAAQRQVRRDDHLTGALPGVPVWPATPHRVGETYLLTPFGADLGAA